jgi:hypothetical protein
MQCLCLSIFRYLYSIVNFAYTNYISVLTTSIVIAYTKNRQPKSAALPSGAQRLIKILRNMITQANNSNDDFFLNLEKFFSTQPLSAWLELEGRIFSRINRELKQEKEQLNRKEFQKFLEENNLDAKDVNKRIEIANALSEVEVEPLGTTMMSKLAAPSLEEARNSLAASEFVNQRTAAEAINTQRQAQKEKRAKSKLEAIELGGELKRVGGSACPKLRFELWLSEEFLELEKDLQKILEDVGGSIPEMLRALVNAYKQASQQLNILPSSQGERLEEIDIQWEKATSEVVEYTEQQSVMVIEEAQLQTREYLNQEQATKIEENVVLAVGTRVKIVNDRYAQGLMGVVSRAKQFLNQWWIELETGIERVFSPEQFIVVVSN